MELETLDWSWRTKDDAKIHFSRYTDISLAEIGDIPPTTLTAVHNQSCLVKPPTIEVPLNELTKLIVSAKCEPRPPLKDDEKGTQWNSNTDCGAYLWEQSHTNGLVLYQVNGSGNHFMFMDQLELLNSFTEIAMTVPRLVVWDLIQSWFSTYHRASDHAAKAVDTKYRQAFVDGRLKKRKNRGQQTFRVWIEQKPAA